MFKWFKITKNQYLGLWLLGLLLFAIQEIPYMIMPLVPLTANPVMDMPTNSLFLDIAEKICGVSCIVVLILIVHKDNKFFSIHSKTEKIFFIIAACIIVLNFIGWIFYFCGFQSVALIIFFIFALPPLYYLFIGLWRKNYFLVIVSSLFFAVHLLNAFVNLL